MTPVDTAGAGLEPVEADRYGLELWCSMMSVFTDKQRAEMPTWLDMSEVSREYYRQHAAAVLRARPADAGMVEALKQAAEWFGQYANGHLAKGAFRKAKLNRERQEFCERAALRPAQEDG